MTVFNRGFLSPLLSAMVAALCLPRHSPAAWPIYTPVALSGQQIPNAPTSAFGDFSRNTRLAVNSAGQVAFEGTTSSGAEGFWVGRPGAIQTVAIQGQAIPSLNSMNYGAIHNDQAVYLNNSGQVFFSTSLSGQGVTENNNEALWYGEPGSVQLVARTGSPAPAPSGFVLRDFASVYRGLNDAGQVLFAHGDVGLITPTTDRGLWAGKPGSLQLVAFQGDPAPQAAGSAFADFLRPRINNDGHIAFLGILDNQERGIWGGLPGSIQAIARKGMPAPGSNGSLYDSLGAPSINNSGQIAFRAWLTDPEPQPTTYQAIYVGAFDAPQLLLKTGMSAPGTAAGTLASLGDPIVTDSGMLAFDGAIDSYGNWGIWAGSPDALHLVARKGTHAPGTPDDVIFSGVAGNYWFSKPNKAGQIAAWFQIEGDAIDPSMNHGIWATSPDGQLYLIAREGGLLNLGNGDIRRITYIGSSFDLNDAGQVAFTAGFEDGTSGVFIAAVPEPGTALLASAIACCLLRRRSRTGY